MFSEPKLASESLGLYTGQYGKSIIVVSDNEHYMKLYGLVDD